MELKTAKSIDGRFTLHIVDSAPGFPFHVWNVNQDEILPGHLIYVKRDPAPLYDWMEAIDENNILAVKHPIYDDSMEFKPGMHVKCFPGGRIEYGIIIESIRAGYWLVQLKDGKNSLVHLYTADIEKI